MAKRKGVFGIIENCKYDSIDHIYTGSIRRHGFNIPDVYFDSKGFREYIDKENPPRSGDRVRFTSYEFPTEESKYSFKALNIQFLDSEHNHEHSRSDADGDTFKSGTGVITRFFSDRGFGFIQPHDHGVQGFIFFHISKIVWNKKVKHPDDLQIGDTVHVTAKKGEKGLCAEKVKVLADDPDDDEGSEYSDTDNKGSEEEINSNAKGYIFRYFPERGYGFITVDDLHVNAFFHQSKIVECHEYDYHDKNVPEEDKRVRFRLLRTQRGYVAENVHLCFCGSARSSRSRSDVGGGSSTAGGRGGTGYRARSPPKAPEREEQEEHPQEQKGQPSSAPTDADSRQKREIGNRLFKSALAKTDEREKAKGLRDALSLYREALGSSTNDDEEVSALKNVAAASLRLALLDCAASPNKVKDIRENFKAALTCFNKAYLKRKCKEAAWGERLESSIRELMDHVQAWLRTVEEALEKVPAVQELLVNLPACDLRPSNYVHIATLIFQTGQAAYNKNLYQESKRCMTLSESYILEAERTCKKDEKIMTNVTSLRKDVKEQSAIADKCIARVEETRKQQAKEDQKAKEKETAMKELGGDLKKLRKFAKRPVQEFIRELFTRWPPKPVTGSKLVPALKIHGHESSANIIKRALCHYHPDKVDERHGVRWTVFCDEVTKCLSQRLAKEKDRK